MIRSASEFQEAYDQAKDVGINSLIDHHYDRLGLDGLDAEWLRETYEDAGIIDSDDDYMFLIPRQQPTATAEQISMAEVGRLLGEQLQEEGEIENFSVVGSPLNDKMYGRNAEKRGYAMPVVATKDGLKQAQIADIQDGFSIGYHEINYRNGTEEVVDEYLGADPEVDTLRGLHESIENPIVQSRGDFTEVQRSMIEEMIAHGEHPEVLGVEDTDGKIVGVKYDSEKELYTPFDEERDITLTEAEASQHGILPPEDNYEALLFPSALHSDIGYMLRGLNNDKFRTEQTDQLERQVQKEGISPFPFIDVSSGNGYAERVPEEAMEDLKNTDFGSSSSLKDSGMVVNVLPSEPKRRQIQDADLGQESFEDVTNQVLDITFG